MKKIIAKGSIAFVCLFVSCKKETAVTVPVVTEPETINIDLSHQEVKYGTGPFLFDFDNDGTRDFLFTVSLSGDPIAGIDKRRFMTSSGVRSKLAVNSDEEVPCMNAGDSIPVADFDDYRWNLVLSVRLVERWENLAGDISWLGNWKYASRKYLPFQMIIDDKPHCGWIELSIDIEHQKLVLHRAAYAKQPEIAIRAGR